MCKYGEKTGLSLLCTLVCVFVLTIVEYKYTSKDELANLHVLGLIINRSGLFLWKYVFRALTFNAMSNRLCEIPNSLFINVVVLWVLLWIIGSLKVALRVGHY